MKCPAGLYFEVEIAIVLVAADLFQRAFSSVGLILDERKCACLVESNQTEVFVSE